jgi:phage major head subunit gpT-like protein
MSETRPKWTQALDKVFRQLFDEGEAKFDSRLDKVFNMGTSENAYEQDTSMSGFGEHEETAELQNIPFEDRVPGWEVTYAHKKYTKGASISQEMIDDNKWGIVKKTPKALALSKMRTLERLGADVLNYGFVAGGGGKAKFRGGDGQALFSTAHVNRQGDVIQGNKITTALSQSSLQAVSSAMKKRLDSKGMIIEFMPSKLIVPTELEYTAKIILESTQAVGNNFNDINPMHKSLELVIWPYLTSSTAWFVLDDDSNELNFFIRKDEGVQGPVWNFDNDSAKWKSVVRASAGYSDWMCIYGSVGDGS